MKLTAFFRHLARHREGYLWLPLVMIGIYLGIVSVNWLTGRPVLDDPGALVGWLYSAFRVALVIFAAAQFQGHVVGFRSERFSKTTPPSFVPLSADIFDLVASLALLCFFAYLLR